MPEKEAENSENSEASEASERRRRVLRKFVKPENAKRNETVADSRRESMKRGPMSPFQKQSEKDEGDRLTKQGGAS